MREIAKYQAIMRSIGNGCTEANEIAQRSGLTVDTPLRDKIERLRVAEQAYQWLQPHFQLPIIREWSRWEGKDRRGETLEVDVAATLADGRVLTGAVKWNSKPLEAKWHLHHLGCLERLAQSA